MESRIVKDQGNNLYFLHSFTFRTLYIVQCTITSYVCTPSLLLSIYRRQEEGDQGTTLYLFTLHSSYYLVTRPYPSVFLHNKVTFTHNNLSCMQSAKDRINIECRAVAQDLLRKNSLPLRIPLCWGPCTLYVYVEHCSACLVPLIRLNPVV